MAPKRKRGKEPRKIGTNAKDNGALIPKGAEPSAPSLTEVEGLAESTLKTVPPAVLTACRSALVQSPAASRNALDKHLKSIDPDLAKALEIVGGYAIEDGSTPLHESVRQGDVATTQALIAAGADITAKDANWATPTALATTCSVCWALLKHLTINKATLTSHPELLVSVAAARCATLAASAETFPTTALFLQAYQLEPSFLWAPPEARNTLFVWAKNAFVAQLAANTLAFAELPDDCAGDVLEWFEMTMTRKDALHIATHCSSPEAHAWLREAVAAAVAARATPKLWLAAKAGDLATVQDCLSKGANVFERFEKVNGNAPIMISSCNGHTDIVEVLLEAGACVHTRDNHGCTALYWACVTHRTATVKRLIEAGADVNVRCLRGETPLIAAHSSVDIMRLLLEAGADIEAKFENGLTLLLDASTGSCNGQTDVVRLLLESGAEIEAKDQDGRTPLLRAVIDGDGGHYEDITRLLLKAGANTEAENEDDQTALIHAASVGHSTIVKLLLEAGANLEAEDEDGHTALIHAASNGHANVVRLLLKAGADKEAEGEDGSTALMHAAINSHASVVKLLLRAGADKDATDEDGKTALMHAALEENNDIVKLLL